MKTTKATAFLKQVLSLVVSMVRGPRSSSPGATTTTVKTKTTTCLAILGSVLRSNRPTILMTSISHKLNALVGGSRRSRGAIVLLSDAATAVAPPPHPDITAAEYNIVLPAACTDQEEEDDDDHYPDLRHCLFDADYEDDDDEDDIDCGAGSAIDFVRNTRLQLLHEQEEGSSTPSAAAGGFCLEDEIDHVADVFIKRFHKHMRLEKKESFKRYMEMLQRSL